MRENTLKIIKGIVEILINKNFRYLVIVIFIINFIYFMFCGYIDIKSLLISIIILIYYSLYKGIANFILITDIKIDNIEKKLYLVMEGLNEKILKKNKGLIKPIYYILYYFPTNGVYLIILGIGRKGGDIRLGISSNKDIIEKRYFKKELGKKTIGEYNKYTIGVKRNIIDIGINIGFIVIYLKMNIIGKEGDKFFKYRLFGIVYSTVLLLNNMNIIIGFRETEIILGKKIIIILIIIYLILKIMNYNILNSIQIKLNEYSEKEKTDNLNIEHKYMITKRLLMGKSLNILLDSKEPFMRRYYFIRRYLLFMCLADCYIDFIDGYYVNMPIKKSLNISNINLPKNFIKLGVTIISGHMILMDNRNDFIGYYNRVLELNIKKKKITEIEILGKGEKNYFISIYFYTFFMKYFYFFIIYGKIEGMNIEIIKIFYSKELIEKYFEEEINEYKSGLFIILCGNNLFDKINIVERLKKKANNEIDKEIPDKIMSNKKYNKILEMSNFLIYYDLKVNYITYINNFYNKEIVLHVNTVKADMIRYEKNYGKDINKFIDFGTKEPNKQDINGQLMQLRIEIFKLYNEENNDYNKNINLLCKKVEEIIVLIKNETIDLDKVLEKIEILQNNHKKKYFINNYSINTKLESFLKKEKMLEKGKDFDIKIGEENLNKNKGQFYTIKDIKKV